MNRIAIILMLLTFPLSASLDASKKITGKKRKDISASTSSLDQEAAASAEEPEVLVATQPVENDEEGIAQEHLSKLLKTDPNKGAFLVKVAGAKENFVASILDIDLVLKNISQEDDDINYQDSKGLTPLLAAASMSNVPLMKKFLEHGAIPAGLKYIFSSGIEHGSFLTTVEICKRNTKIAVKNYQRNLKIICL